MFKLFDAPKEQLLFWLQANICDELAFVENLQRAAVTERNYEPCANDVAVHMWYSEILIHTSPNDRDQFGFGVNRTILEFFLSR